MTEEERVARLEFYKEEAKAQWEALQRAQKTPSKFLVIAARMGHRIAVAIAAAFTLVFVIAEAFDHRFWGVLAILGAVPIAVLLLRMMEAGAYDETETFWKNYALRQFAVVLLWVLFTAVTAIAVFV